MMGNRAMIADGWKIVTYRELGDPYDSVPWELYNLNEDFSESNNLADKYPEKVAELEAKWWASAERYNVLPIDDRDFVLRIYKTLDHFENRNRKKAVYYPGTDTIDKFRAPTLANRSFTITAHINNYQPGDSGVLAAQGEIDSGYTFYIKDNRLHYEVNAARTKYGSLTSDRELPAGNVTVSFKFDKINLAVGLAKGLMKKSKKFDWQSLLKGEGYLYINDEMAAKAHFDLGVPLVTWEGLDIGLDRRLPASRNYTPPFSFSGKLEKVVYDIE
jgi:arylsulfatase